MIPVHVQTIELVKNRVARQVSVGRLSKEVFVFFAESGMSVRVHDLSISISLNLLLPLQSVNTDALECLHKQTQSSVQTHSHKAWVTGTADLRSSGEI